MYIYIYIYIYMLRPNSQPLDGFETDWPASKMSGRFWSWLLILYDSMQCEILNWWFVVKHLETTLYTLFFLINVANRSNNQCKPWALWKQASIVLVSAQPVSKPCRLLPRRLAPVGFEAIHPVPAGFEAVHLVPAGFEAVHPAGFEVGHYLFTGDGSGQPVSKQAGPLWNQPAGFKMGWVANRALTYIYTCHTANSVH